jgi:hypothetical protein
MATSHRWKLRALLLAGFAACFGCNPLLFPLFIQGESRHPATLRRLAKDDQKKELKVALVTRSVLSARQELINADRELCQKAAQQLRVLAQHNGDKLAVIEPRKVEQYLANHPDWKNLEPADLADDLGAALKADYVVFIEINSMSLIGKGGDLYQGRAELHVCLYNAADPDDGPRHKDLRAAYPDPEIEYGRAIDQDTSLPDFRSEFLDVLGKKIAYCFCDHPTINECDPTRKGLAD